MDNECNEDERVFRFETFHQAIYTIENDINKELLNSDMSKKNYIPFSLINKGICDKYPFLLNKNFDRNVARKQEFNYKDLVKANVNKNFKYINKSFTFTFPTNFMFINKYFLDVINNYIPRQYTRQIGTIFNIIIGRECIMMKDAFDNKNENPFRYLTLYSEIEEKKGNEIDFFIYIKNKKERQDDEEYIYRKIIYEIISKKQDIIIKMNIKKFTMKINKKLVMLLDVQILK